RAVTSTTRRTSSTTASELLSCRASATQPARRTARAARLRPASPRPWRGNWPPGRSPTASAISARARVRWAYSVVRGSSPLWHNRGVRFLRMKPGHGEVMIAEGDVDTAEDRERLIEEFRRQLDQGLWAAVPLAEIGRA